jgi:hypothetical protein
MQMRVQFAWLLWLALALQCSQYVPALRLDPAGTGHRVLLLVSYGIAAAWLLLNVARRRQDDQLGQYGLWGQYGLRAGIAVAGLGWALNAVVVVADNGMPVSTAAGKRAGIIHAVLGPAIWRGQLYKHTHATSAAWLRPLGDVIPLRPLHAVVSPGDLILWIGVVITIAAAMGTARVGAGQIAVAAAAPAPGAGKVAIPRA